MKARITSNYTLGSRTLHRDQSKIVVFLSKIVPKGAYIRYDSYASGSQLSMENQDFKIKDQNNHRAHFKVLQRLTPQSNMVQINKREFDNRYAYKKPQFSESQNLCFFFDCRPK